MAIQIKDETFKLTQSVSGITATAITVAISGLLQACWEYQVPADQSLVFSAEDTFSAYLSTSVPAEAGAGSLIEIVIMDASKHAAKPLLNPLRYTRVKEFTDRDKLCHLDVESGKVMVADQGEWVTIRANISATFSTTVSYFELTCKRVRRSIF